VSFAEDGVSGILSVTALFWPIVTAVLAVLVLVGVFLLWRKWRQLRSRFRSRDVPVA
jgi:ABC-type nickel/cobalt efflux system permease component RcnA